MAEGHLSQRTQVVWGKSNDRGAWLALLGHALDVAAVSLELLDREPATARARFTEEFGLNEPDALRVVAAVVGAHDIGKVTPGFQAKSPEGRLRLEACGFRWTPRSLDVAPPHGVITRKVLPQYLKRSLGWASLTAEGVGDAVAAHHGFRISEVELRGVTSAALGEVETWGSVRLEILDALFGVVGVPLSVQPGSTQLSGAGFMLLAGLTSVADWIGSNSDYFTLSRSVDYPDQYFLDSRKRASAALDSIGWPKFSPLSSGAAGFSLVFGFDPRPLQDVCARLVGDAEAPVLVLVEAPMGEGKTEAALLAHLQLERQIGHRGMYFALPSQATGNAMFDRVRNFLQAVAPTHHTDLQLVHGAALMNDSWTSMRLCDVERDGEATAAVVAHEWFTNKKRALLSPFGVGTVDQALLSALSVKHQFVRMWGLANRTVVIDEVHAYDVYTSGLLERLLGWLRALGSSAILMSATLPRSRREALLQAWGSEVSGPSTYPRVTVTSGEVSRHESFRSSRPTNLLVRPAPQQVSELAPFLLDLVRTGGNVACVVNTVDRAQGLFKEISRLAVQEEWSKQLPLRLFHARFPAQQRRTIEEEVVGIYGPSAPRRPQTSMLIATQVVEQSLNVDFDALVSDLAPIDLLLQRAGRAHRHDSLERPAAHGTPILWISGLSSGSAVPDLGAAAWVYDEFVLLRTWAVLQGRLSVSLPEDIEYLVDAVYEDETAPPGIEDELRSAIEAARVRSEVDRQNENALAARVALPTSSEFLDVLVAADRLADDDDPALHPTLQPRTRLGRPSVTAIPLFEGPSGLSLWRDGDGAVALDRVPSWSVAKQLVARSISISRPQVFRHLVSSPVPGGWARHPLLRYARPLVLNQDACAEVGGLIVSLDETLGLVVSRTASNGEEGE